MEQIAIKEIGQHSRIIDAAAIDIRGVEVLSDGRRVMVCLVDGIPQHLEWIGLRDHPEGITPFANAGL